MSEVVNVVVAFAVIVFILRWVSRGGSSGADDVQQQRRARELLGFQPKNVTSDMISTVQTMFPDIPRDNIQYDLLKTGNVQTTTNKLLERGYLEAPPPAYFQLYPTQPAAGAGGQSTPGASLPTQPTKQTLITRYSLQDQVDALADPEKEAQGETPGGKAVWEDTPERREASLKERKAQMVLAARKRFLEQQQSHSTAIG